MILAIDPGTTESGWCIYDGKRVVDSGITANAEMLYAIPYVPADRLAIEMIASYGMAVGREVFETVWWIGRFTQAYHKPEEVIRIYRQEVKLFVCKDTRAKDSNIRQGLIDMLGPPGTKKNPGPTYGIKSHAWAALGVAVTAASKLGVSSHG
jgi:hypothetical protein